ncbi:MAG: hypothetical protein NWE93_04375 [Candidatus Bathyarchaeota archaeon]|nr:hypothetical protein [Candidatus Bathyarchaeota archaeon]
MMLSFSVAYPSLFAAAKMPLDGENLQQPSTLQTEHRAFLTFKCKKRPFETISFKQNSRKSANRKTLPPNQQKTRDNQPTAAQELLTR